MTNYINCERPDSQFGPIMCNKCARKYSIEFDLIKAPYKESGVLRCGCGVDLVKWNLTNESSLKLIK